MSVIGRLDDQVNEMIIKPVSERRKPQDEETETPAPESTHDDDDERAKPAPSALPVWLL